MLVTVGHGTLSSDAFVALLEGAQVTAVVDVRRYPASRRNPHFDREVLEATLAGAGMGYRWEQRLGGRRSGSASSPHVALRHPSFRAYADHMETPGFAAALDEVVGDAADVTVAVLCAESVWWRCHRRLIADAAELLAGVDVRHLLHDGRVARHRVTGGVGVTGTRLVYDRGEDRTLPGVGQRGRVDPTENG